MGRDRSARRRGGERRPRVWKRSWRPGRSSGMVFAPAPPSVLRDACADQDMAGSIHGQFNWYLRTRARAGAVPDQLSGPPPMRSRNQSLSRRAPGRPCARHRASSTRYRVEKGRQDYASEVTPMPRPRSRELAAPFPTRHPRRGTGEREERASGPSCDRSPHLQYLRHPPCISIALVETASRPTR